MNNETRLMIHQLEQTIGEQRKTMMEAVELLQTAHAALRFVPGAHSEVASERIAAVLADYKALLAE